MAENIIWGYARVSSTSQNLDRQLDALRAMGIEERYILSEKKSGKDFERPAFLSLVGTDTVAPSLRAGDCLVITSLDRLIFRLPLRDSPRERTRLNRSSPN